MNRMKITALTGMFFLATSSAAWAQTTSDSNAPDWKSMGASELLWAAQNLTGDDPAVTAARQSIVDQLATRFLADAAATRGISCSQWRGFAKALSAGLTAEQRGQWIGKIRAAYVQDAAGLAFLKQYGDIENLIGALGVLGDKQDDVDGIAATFIKGTTLWQAWSPGDVAGLASRIAALGESGTAARQTIISMVTSKYVSAGSGKSLTLGQWQSFSGSLAPGLSAEAKAQWAAIITQAYADSGETAISLTARDVEQLTSILERLDAKDLAADLMARLAGDSNAVQPMSFDKLIWMLESLTGDTPAIKAARQKIADLVTTKFLADPAATRTVSSGQWHNIASRLSAGMTAEQRGQWASKLRAAYVLDSTGLASLKEHSALECLINALTHLGEKQDDVDGVAATFVKGTTLWQSWPPGDVASLATRIAALGESGAAARQAIVAAVTSKYVSTGSAKSLTPGHWESLTGTLAPGLSAEAKAQWAAAITQAYVGSGETVGSLTARDVEQLIAALGRLDAGDQAVDAVAKLVNDSTAWQGWDLKSQVWLLGMLAAPDSRESTKPARLKILDRMTATYMPTAEEAKKVPLRQWANLIMGLYDVMPAETRTLWAERLRGVFDNATLATLGTDAEQRNALLPAIAILDDKMKTGLALAWLKDRALWQGAPIEALANLAVSAYRDNPDETLPILDDVDKYCVARHATQPLTLDECLALRGMYVSVGQMAKAQQWVLVGCDVTIGTAALRAAADQATVVSLSLALVDTGMVGPEKDCSKFAATVAAVAAKGGLDFRQAWEPKCVGEALGTPAGRQIVRDALLDAAGNPRLDAAKVLASAYRTYSDFKAWQGYVGQQLAGASDGDKKALWLLAKGYTDSIIPDKQNLLRIEFGATAALAQASTDPVRLLAIRELADSYDQTGRPGVGAKVLESIKGQFAGESLTAVQSIQDELQKKEASRLVKHEQEKVAAEAARKKALLAYYQNCLAQATARGDSAEAARLQAAIRKLSD